MKALLAIHGFTTDKNDFCELKRCSKLYDHVEFFEAPGHGEDRTNTRAFTSKRTMQKLLKTYDNLASQYDTIDVVGFSMGGALATFLTSARKVNRVVLLAPSNKYVNIWIMANIYSFTRKTYRKVFKNCQGTLASKRRQTMRYLKWLFNDVQKSLTLVKSIVVQSRPRHIKQFMAIMSTCNKYIKNKVMSTPALIIRGNIDQLVPYSSVTHVKKHFSNVKEVRIDGLGHLMLPSSFGSKIEQEMLDFLSQK